MKRRKKKAKPDPLLELPAEVFVYVNVEDSAAPFVTAERTLKETAERDEVDTPKLVGRYQLVETITVEKTVRIAPLKH